MAHDPVLEIVDPGLLLSIQDGGRAGMAAHGVTRGGAADRHSLAVAKHIDAAGGDNVEAAAGLALAIQRGAEAVALP